MFGHARFFCDDRQGIRIPFKQLVTAADFALGFDKQFTAVA